MFWNTLGFLMIQWMLAIFDSSAFLKSNLYVWNVLVHMLLKPSMEDFQHNFVSIRNECLNILCHYPSLELDET